MGMNSVKYDYQFVDSSMLEETKKKCGESHFEGKSLLVNAIDNAYVLPCVDCWRGGIVDERGMYYEHSFIQRGAGGAYEFNKSECEYCDEEVVYVGMFHTVWGHCITDNLKHLWFLFCEEYDSLKKKKFVYTTLSPSFDLPQNAKNLFAKLGLNFDNLIRINSITKFKRIYLPEDCFIRWTNKGCWYTSEYKMLIDNIINSTTNNKRLLQSENNCHHSDHKLEERQNRIYFTRTQLNSNKDYGEERIEKVFKKIGYQIVEPEKLSLDEQINLIRHCSVLAATEGSITHNAVFLKEGSDLVIVRKRNFVNEYQLAINEMRGLHVTYIDSHKSTRINKKFSFTGPFFMYCSRNLSKFAEIRKPIFPVFPYMVYLWENKPDHLVGKILKKLFFIPNN